MKLRMDNALAQIDRPQKTNTSRSCVDPIFEDLAFHI